MTFINAWPHYQQAGWPCYFPINGKEKGPPPKGFTGADGRDTTPDDIALWARTRASDAIAIRMPDGVIGIDVDHYDKGEVGKRGGDTIAELQRELGPLPPTWRSTARGADNPSGTYLYRVPSGRYQTTLGNAIDVIQRHHRYTVAWPSVHYTGGVYTWYTPDGNPSEEPPTPGALPELPEEWVAYLAEGAAEASPVAAEASAGMVMLTQLTTDDRPACVETANTLTGSLEAVRRATTGGRHDAMSERVYLHVMLGAEGHPGAAAALAALEELWGDLTSGEDRASEWDRMALTAARKAVTRVGVKPVDRDPCLLTSGWSPPTGPPGVSEPITAEPIAAAPAWSLAEAIGAHPWDPGTDLDTGIAAQVLDRLGPVLRYAVDSGTWVLAGGECWAERKDLASWAVITLAGLHPRGLAGAEKGTPEQRQWARFVRLNSAAGINSVGGVMRGIVSSGHHGASLNLADLDAEPHILWAGGVPWDLLTLRPAEHLYGVPHLHAAAVAPADIPTPRWDAFVAAVWPDPEMRRWALRVLSVALTGEPDAVMPILQGPTRSGKSQIVTLLMSVLGSYGVAADPRLLDTGAGGTHASVVMALRGKRLAFLDEGPKTGKWAQERLKQLTGGTALTANAMRADPITFRPTHTLVMTANDEPPVLDAAVRARLRLIPCSGDLTEVRTARQAIGPLQGAAWRAEMPGVLWQMMREASAWYADPSTAGNDAAPQFARDRVDLMAAEQDTVLTWRTDMAVDDDLGTTTGELHKAYVGWCRDHGIRPADVRGPKGFSQDLDRQGYPTVRQHGTGARVKLLKLVGMTRWTAPTLGGAEASSVKPDEKFSGVTKFDHDTERPSTKSDEDLTDAKRQEGGSDAKCQDKCQDTKTTGQSTDDLTLFDTLTVVLPTTTTTTTTTTYTYTQENPGSEVSSDKVSNTKITAAQRKADAKAAARAEAAGPRVELPALVDRAGRITPLSLAEAEAVIRGEAASGALTVDVETSGYPMGHPAYELRTVQLGGPMRAVVLDATLPEHRNLARATLAEAPVLHAHSATADLAPLAYAGLVDHEDAWGRMADTVITAKLAYPASTGSDPGLKALAGKLLPGVAVSPAAEEAKDRLFKVNGWLKSPEPATPTERNGWYQVDAASSTMVRYAASDVLDTAAIARFLPALPADLLDRERAVQRILARVTLSGLKIDGAHVEALIREHRPQLDELGNQIRAMGVENPDSDKMLAGVLTGLGVRLPRTAPSSRFPDGQASVSRSALEGLSGLHGPSQRLVEAVLQHRHHGTVLSTFLEPYRVLVEHGDGYARPTLYTLGTDTGRMSCVRPNLQQVPRTGRVRACIRAREGYRLVSADFSSVEVRVMAALSQDPVLINLLAQGIDLHAVVAEQAFGPEWSKADRYTAKRGVFGWAYGGSIPSLASQLGVSESVMAAVIDSLREVAPTYVRWANELKSAVRRGLTQFPTYSGRTIYLDKRQPHKAPNYAIQGTARELLVDALLEWERTPYGGGIILPIHDEVIAEVPEDHAEAATEALVTCMTRELHGVKIVAEASEPSVSWKDAA